MRRDHFILGENVEINLNSHETWLNNNILIVGSSGTGKTRTIVEPNLQHPVGSYVISDPKGMLYQKFAKIFKKNGMNVQKIDLIHPEQGSYYNPLDFISNDRDILKIATILNNSTESFDRDPFWDKTSLILLISLIYYLIEISTPEDD